MTEQERFRHAVRVVLEHEGGYVDDPDDNGGETKYGISKRNYPHLDIANLTRAAAEQIYYEDWWLKYGYDKIESPVIATKILDLAVNVGPRQAHICLQQALHACGERGVTIDGIMGPQTIGTANRTDSSNLLVGIRAEAAAYYRQLIGKRPALQKYRRGWLDRAYS